MFWLGLTGISGRAVFVLSEQGGGRLRGRDTEKITGERRKEGRGGDVCRATNSRHPSRTRWEGTVGWLEGLGQLWERARSGIDLLI